ncbi:MAG: hypothetical protein WDZ38_06310, partial [Balneolaceae bacterium]
DDGDQENKTFDGVVQTVNLNNQSFLLKGGLLLYVDSNTEFKGDGDYIQSLQELNDANSPQNNITAKGIYYTNETNRNIVVEVEFEL